MNNYKITISKSYCVTLACIHAILLAICHLLALYIVFKSIEFSKTTEIIQLKLCSYVCALFSVCALALCSRFILADFISCINLCIMKIELREDGMQISRKARSYFVNLTTSKALRSMSGWLITWPEDGKHQLLLRKNFLLWHFKDIDLYIRKNMNVLSEHSEKKKFLKSMRINVYSPWKYVKWPGDETSQT